MGEEAGQGRGAKQRRSEAAAQPGGLAQNRLRLEDVRQELKPRLEGLAPQAAAAREAAVAEARLEILRGAIVWEEWREARDLHRKASAPQQSAGQRVEEGLVLSRTARPECHARGPEEERPQTRASGRPAPPVNPSPPSAGLRAAGMKGIGGGYELPGEAATNRYQLTPEQLLAEGIGPLPGSLADALDLMAKSDLMAETLGEHVFEYVLLNKRREWAGYRAQVTPFELSSNLEIL